MSQEKGTCGRAGEASLTDQMRLFPWAEVLLQRDPKPGIQSRTLMAYKAQLNWPAVAWAAGSPLAADRGWGWDVGLPLPGWETPGNGAGQSLERDLQGPQWGTMPQSPPPETSAFPRKMLIP